MSSDEDVCMEDNESDSDQEEEFLDYNGLETDMMAEIENVKTVIEVSDGTCRLLLQKYKWNNESLLERFYENPDTNAFLVDAHLLPGKSVNTPPNGATAECEICCMEGELSGLACNHLACNDCWNSYLSEKIKEGQSAIECMASDCKLLMGDEIVFKYIDDPTAIASYRRVLVNSYVNSNMKLRWCPGNDCGRAVKVSAPNAKVIICPCKTRFCFSCGNEGHEPINCRLLKLWAKKCADDSETFNWINANTKDCPKCSAPIEKNGGCNYMRCQNASCKFEFCWMCFGSWKDEGAHNCNAFNDQGNENRDKSRISLERYLFYYNRFVNHANSLKLEKKLRGVVDGKMNEMQEMEMSWVEVQFLQKAIDVLSECRRTLMFTYAFAFFLKRDNNTIIFEENQADLERATEQLSGFLERELEKDGIVDLKQKVQDKCRYVEHRRRALLNHCSEGNDLDFWVYNE